MVTIVEIGPGIRRERSMPGLHWKATPMVFGTLLVRTDGSVRFSRLWSSFFLHLICELA